MSRRFLLVLLLLPAFVRASRAAETAEEFWHLKVDPILDRYCLKCHAGVRQKSGLDLRSLETTLRGGDRGPAMIPGRPEASRLLEFIARDADPHMPPEGKKQLTPEEIAVLRKGIALFPKPKLSPAAAGSTNTTWVAGYLSELKASHKPLLSPRPSATPTEVIDQAIALRWKMARVKPSDPVSDRAFARRIYLDLAGRIPTPEELAAFEQDRRSGRRERLADALLASPEYASHMRDVFDVVLMGRPKKNGETARRDNGWTAFLERCFRENRPWNDVVRSLILARGTNDWEKGSAWYLYERKNNHQAMAEAVSSLAFGVQIGCAQCHNHPLAWEIEQRHYWGLVAAFNRSQGINTKGGIGVAESANGGFIQFTNLKKESQPAALAFLNGKVVPEKPDPEKPSDDLYLVPPVKEGERPAVASIPKFSRRAALADAATTDNPMLARAFVNRTWALLLGRGLVHPVDSLDSRHPASHPELLEWLSSDFERHGYDVKRLIRSIVLSRPYSLDSHPRGPQPPPPELFARGLEKPLTAEQLLDSILVATGNFSGGQSGPARYEELRREFTKKFPDLLPPVYNPSLEQALFFSNSPWIAELLKRRTGNRTDELLSAAEMNDRIYRAYRVTLGREPAKDELEKCRELLGRSTPEAGARDLLWCLISGAEFQVNH